MGEASYPFDVAYISVSFATFEPCKSHAMHREVAATRFGLSHCHG